jgi:hypothetical protein
MGLKIKFQKPPNPQPELEQREDSIFDALGQFLTGKMGTLMLVHRGNGQSYRVIKYDAKTQRVLLVTSDKKKLNPMLTEREAKIYKPMWR